MFTYMLDLKTKLSTGMDCILLKKDQVLITFLRSSQSCPITFMTIRTIIFINKLIHTQDIIFGIQEISYSCPKVTLKELS